MKNAIKFGFAVTVIQICTDFSGWSQVDTIRQPKCINFRGTRAQCLGGHGPSVLFPCSQYSIANNATLSVLLVVQMAADESAFITIRFDSLNGKYDTSNSRLHPRYVILILFDILPFLFCLRPEKVGEGRKTTLLG